MDRPFRKLLHAIALRRVLRGIPGADDMKPENLIELLRAYPKACRIVGAKAADRLA